jgi:hypothetical protein
MEEKHEKCGEKNLQKQIKIVFPEAEKCCMDKIM